MPVASRRSQCIPPCLQHRRHLPAIAAAADLYAFRSRSGRSPFRLLPDSSPLAEPRQRASPLPSLRHHGPNSRTPAAGLDRLSLPRQFSAQAPRPARSPHGSLDSSEVFEETTRIVRSDDEPAPRFDGGGGGAVSSTLAAQGGPFFPSFLTLQVAGMDALTQIGTEAQLEAVLVCLFLNLVLLPR